MAHWNADGRNQTGHIHSPVYSTVITFSVNDRSGFCLNISIDLHNSFSLYRVEKQSSYNFYLLLGVLSYRVQSHLVFMCLLSKCRYQ